MATVSSRHCPRHPNLPRVMDLTVSGHQMEGMAELQEEGRGTANYMAHVKLAAHVLSKRSVNPAYSSHSHFYTKETINNGPQETLSAKSGVGRVGGAEATFTGAAYLRREEVGQNSACHKKSA